MKLNLVIFIGICIICGIRYSEAGCCPKPKPVEITDANIAAVGDCLKGLVNTYRNQDRIKKIIIERVTTIKEKFIVTVQTRGLFSGFQNIIRNFYNGAASIIHLLLPRNKDLFDVTANTMKRILKYCIRNNPSLLDVAQKIVLAGTSIARIACDTFIKQLLRK
ncbi:uncharacterized protein LOC114331193 [Diabrotica virgifera virgifera]|uniref:Uncharacterized protein LOC114331193 n=1 Tax=Diabrotica virgifera virgifera TaxID=50390 RepID=A0A6P7FK28_DIAVI|nr:uncharacterized protein LOC114331193 [Diabrotica virgifera virgifera]